MKGKAERAFYYDAIDYNKSENETQADCDRRVAEREALHAYINSLPGFHVRDGRVRKSPKKRGREQKGVDVLLAVDAMEHAARRNMQLAVFITGDLDFEPLLNSLLRLGVRTQLKYVPLQTSPELRAAADEIRKITLEHFFAWSGPSFRENHKQMKILYGERHPEPPIFEIAREGSWNGRRVLLYQPTNQSWPRLAIRGSALGGSRARSGEANPSMTRPSRGPRRAVPSALGWKRSRRIFSRSDAFSSSEPRKAER